MVDKLKALADESRLEILRLVSREEMPAGEIAAHFQATRPAVSQHLRVLKSAGLITERRVGTKRLYRLNQEGVEELRAYLSGFWDQRLIALKHAAERSNRRRNGRK